MSISRRGFLKGLLGAAGVAVAGPAIAALDPDHERWLRDEGRIWQVRGGKGDPDWRAKAIKTLTQSIQDAEDQRIFDLLDSKSGPHRDFEHIVTDHLRVLSADDPKARTIGYSIHENMGIGVSNRSVELDRLTRGGGVDSLGKRWAVNDPNRPRFWGASWIREDQIVDPACKVRIST